MYFYMLYCVVLKSIMRNVIGMDFVIIKSNSIPYEKRFEIEIRFVYTFKIEII